MSTIRFTLLSIAACGAAAIFSFTAYQNVQQHALPALTTAFQAVAMNNGQVFFGRVSQPSGDYLLLQEVFYVQTRQNPQTHETANVLVKRGGEAHGPDQMLLNRQQVTLIEPVSESSNIGKLIAEQRR